MKMKTDYGLLDGSEQQIKTLTKRLMLSNWWGKKQEDTLPNLLLDCVNHVRVKMLYSPKDFRFHIILTDSDNINSIQMNLYGKIRYPKIPSFVSLSRKTIYVNIDKINRKVLYHEIGHLMFNDLIDNKRVGSSLHEHIAQFCENKC